MTDKPNKNSSSSIRTMAFLLLLMPLVDGCSLRLPERELSIGYAAERDGTERRVIGGLDLRFGGRWPGVHAGFEDTTVSSASRNATNQVGLLEEPAQFAPPLALTWTRLGVVHHAGWFHRVSKSPVGAIQFIGGSNLGLGVNWHPSATSFDLGYSRQTLLIAQPRTEGVFLIDFDSRHVFDRVVICYQTNQNDIPNP